MSSAAAESCFEPARLQEVVTQGFGDGQERALFLAHFGLDCPRCGESFQRWAMQPEPLKISYEIEPVAGERGPLYDPPRRALLRRRADLRGGFEPSTRTRSEPLEFLRLLLDEARHAALGLPEEAAVACLQLALEDLRRMRRALAQNGPPPGCRPSERSNFERMALEGLASEALAAELQIHGRHSRAEPLRREAETTRLLSHAGLWIDEFLTRPGARP